MSKTTKRLARLTRAEDATYSGAFEHYMNNIRRDTKRADRFAWSKCVAEFPRLAKYEGAKA